MNCCAILNDMVFNRSEARSGENRQLSSCPKTFWKTSKQILKLGWVSASILTLHHNVIYTESDLEKANFLNTYFSSQAVVDDTK